MIAASLTRPWWVLVIIAGVLSGPGDAPQTYRVDATQSVATIHVGKAGAFSFLAGHSHEVRGPIESGSVDVDADNPSQSRIRIAIDAASLKVLPEHEPEGDAPKVQEAMDSDKVLDIARYPRVTYESTAVDVRQRDANRLELMVTGRLTIRDVVREVTSPVTVNLRADGLSANGRFTVKQSAFGIKPISVGGVVAVKDELDIEFSIVAAK